MPTDVIGVPPLNSNLPVNKEDFATWTNPWGNWLTKAGMILFASSQSGTTALRPVNNLYISRPYFDTTLGYPVFWNGSGWVDAQGTPA